MDVNEKMDEAIVSTIVDIEKTADSVKRSELQTLLGELVDINERIRQTERLDKKLLADIEFKREENRLAEEKFKLDTATRLKQIEVDLVKFQNDIQKQNDADAKNEFMKLEELKIRREEIIGKILIAVFGVASAGAGAFLSVRGWMKIFDGLHEMDRKDKIPSTNAFDFFRKFVKF